DLGVVPLLADTAVGHVVVLVEGGVWCRHFDRAVLPSGSEIGMCRRIRDHGAVDLKRVVMKADDQGRGGDAPDAIGPSGHVETGTDSQPYLLRARSHDTEKRSVIGVDAGIFRLGNVQR